jgi:diketogulonate reductase-like aldo/keto reductase
MSEAKNNDISTQTITLATGATIPVIGLGVFKAKPGEQTQEAVLNALRYGYRHIDTAQGYKNEEDVGAALKQSGIPRDQVFITTKLWGSEATHTYEGALETMKSSLEKLGLEYVDLFLMHSPFKPESREETWRAIEEMKARGWAKNIGVSNFGKHHLEALLKVCKEKPVVNQVELNPFIQRRELCNYCTENRIVMQAYSPLTRGRRLNDEKLVKLAQSLNVTPAQVFIRWCIQKGYVVLPKSVQLERIQENANVFGFSIPEEVMQELETWDEYYVTGWDPTVDP